MAKTPTDIQQPTDQAPADMPLPDTMVAQPPQAAPTVFSESTMENAAKDAKMKFVTSLIERHLSSDGMRYEHLHETTSAMTDTAEPRMGVTLAVTPTDSSVTNEEVLAQIQAKLGQIPIIQEQYNGLSSNKMAIEKQITEAAKAEDTERMNQLLDEYKSTGGGSGKKFRVDFPVGNDRTFHVRLDGITIDQFIQSMVENTNLAPKEPAPVMDQPVTAQGKEEPVLDAKLAGKPVEKDIAAQAVNPEMLAAQADQQAASKWAAKTQGKDISPGGVIAEQAAAAGKANNR